MYQWGMHFLQLAYALAGLSLGISAQSLCLASMDVVKHLIVMRDRYARGVCFKLCLMETDLLFYTVLKLFN
jgi:hypothetical protein